MPMDTVETAPDSPARASCVPAPSAAQLATLRYDPATGAFTKLHRAKTRPHYERPAGFVNRYGYLSIKLGRVAYRGHRLAWFISYGEWPEDSQIDHINGDRADNRIENLRLATKSQNMMNRGIQAGNTTGYKGVSLDKSKGQFRASIKVMKRHKHLGYFDRAEDAAIAYAKASLALHGEFAHSPTVEQAIAARIRATYAQP